MPSKKVAPPASHKNEPGANVTVTFESLKRVVDKFYEICENDMSLVTHIFERALADSTSWYKYTQQKDNSIKWVIVDVVSDVFEHPLLRSLHALDFDDKNSSKSKPVNKESFLNLVKLKTSANVLAKHVKANPALTVDFLARTVYDVVTKWMLDLTKKASKLVNDFKKTPGEKADAPMGKWAWPQERSGIFKNKNLPYEKSTALEVQLYRAIVAHFKGEVGSITDDVAAKLQSFLKKGMYVDIIHPPKSKTLYRGLTVSDKWLAKILGYKSVKDLPEEGTVNKSFTFSPKKGAATSWSSKMHIATHFAGGLDAGTSAPLEYQVPGVTYGLLMHASVNDNPDKFVSASDGLYNLTDVDHFANESEIVGLGPIKVTKVQFVRYV